MSIEKKRSSWYIDNDNFRWLQKVAKNDSRSMNQMLNTLLRRCREGDTTTEADLTAAPNSNVGVPGYVYVFGDGEGLYKIGFSRQPGNRLRSLQTGVSRRLNTVLLINCHEDDMKAIESTLHERFKDKRTRGEWFKLEDADIDWITNAKLGVVHK